VALGNAQKVLGKLRFDLLVSMASALFAPLEYSLENDPHSSFWIS
jgi:hypothetical protein